LAALLGLILMWVLDRRLAQAGLLTLLFLVGTVGTAHGVLDTLLIVRQLHTSTSRWLVAGAYLLAALVTASLLHRAPAVALMVLLGLSLWHFGEHFDRTVPGQIKPAPAQQLFTRLLRGGAPVLMPALVAQSALAPQAHVAAGGDAAAAAMLWTVWTGMAYLWAAALGVWCLQSLLAPQGTPASRRRLLAEVMTIAALYALLSPLMAFAIYFGAYHAIGHIQRVLGTQPKAPSQHWQSDLRVWGTLALTVLLGISLVAWMLPLVNGLALPDVALRTVILALAAVSVPHVVLIGWWARSLRATPT
jgi:beta-carotene 15,15'-dioxygenase